jgi:hypothetical protein
MSIFPSILHVTFRERLRYSLTKRLPFLSYYLKIKIHFLINLSKIKGFDQNKNVTIINKLRIEYDDSEQNLLNSFPKEFKIKLNQRSLVFKQINKDKYHPIASDQIYTVDANENIIKVNPKNQEV